MAKIDLSVKNFISLVYYLKACGSQGPIERLSISRNASNANRDTKFQARSWLRTGLRGPAFVESALYQNCDGTGSASNPWLASLKSISESLERWAYYSTVMSSQFGFDIDPSTNGIAAFPKLRENYARTHAKLEAAERWSLRSWWYGRLAIAVGPTYNNNQEIVQTFVIKMPGENIYTAILHSKNMSKQKKYYFHSYGFAAEHSVEKAVRKAQVELERNSDVLSLFYDSNDSTTTSSSQELRLVHFSTNEGFSQFEEMTKKSPEAIKLITHTPRLMIDLNIPGPWSKYTCVWRCLYEPAYPLEIQKHEFFF